MADRTIVAAIQNYLRYVKQQGIPVSFGVLFGSYAKNTAHQLSDIDSLVVSPRFDGVLSTNEHENLWMYAARTDRRIEPIPVGEKQFETDNNSIIVVVARREGQITPLAE